MASNTINLNLLKKDPLTDGNDTFNIKTMLNDNWDKIDEFAGETIPISRGGTGATTAEQALANLGGIAASAVGNLHVWERVQSGVTDYLTSTDRNAYPDQSAEGGQDAYYTLGDITNDCIVWQANTTNSSSDYFITVDYGDSIHIDSNGTISINNPSTASLYVSNSDTVTKSIVGKYVYTKRRGSGVTGGFETGMVYYIPESATVSHQSYNRPYTITISEVQSVTGHAAIPANNTITYLGQLGDGARIEVGSYVGTGNFSVSINVNKNAKFIVISSGGVIGFFVPTDETFSSFKVSTRYADYYKTFNATMTNGALSWSGSEQNNYSDELYLCSSGVTFYIFTIC